MFTEEDKKITSYDVEKRRAEKAKNRRLHNSFNLLVAEAIRHGGLSFQSSIFDLYHWSYKRTT